MDLPPIKPDPKRPEDCLCPNCLKEEGERQKLNKS